MIPQVGLLEFESEWEGAEKEACQPIRDGS